MKVLLFPVDLFRFTVHCWLYTFGMMTYRWRLGYEDQPCVFCRGTDVGDVPRDIGNRMKYRNVWLARLLNPDITLQKDEAGGKPSPVCMREGGYVTPPFWIPLAAVCLGAFWCILAGIAFCNSGIIPEEVKTSLLAGS